MPPGSTGEAPLWGERPRSPAPCPAGSHSAVTLPRGQAKGPPPAATWVHPEFRLPCCPVHSLARRTQSSFRSQQAWGAGVVSCSGSQSIGATFESTDIGDEGLAPPNSPGLLGYRGGELQSPVVSICVFIFKEPQVSGGENGALISELPKDGTHWQPGWAALRPKSRPRVESLREKLNAL